MVASRNSRKAAHNALKAYQATPGFAETDGMMTSITDLIADLLHLAEAVSGQDGETTGEHAILHYQMDLDEIVEPQQEQWQKDLSALGTEPGEDGEVLLPPPGFTGPWAG